MAKKKAKAKGKARRPSPIIAQRLARCRREMKKKRVKAYSMGMRRRLGLACVLIGQPDVLLLDEPISGLDPEGMRLFVELMREEKARGAALVFSSHHLGHAEELSDEVFVLDRGAVVLSGGVADIARAVGDGGTGTVDGARNPGSSDFRGQGQCYRADISASTGKSW